MDTRRFSDADHRALAEARLPLRTEPVSICTNPDVEYGPINERVIRYVVKVFNVLLDAADGCRPHLSVWRDMLVIVYPDGTLWLECAFEDDELDVTIIDCTKPLHDCVRTLVDTNGQCLSARACAEHVLDVRASEPMPRVEGVVIHVADSERPWTSTSRLSALQWNIAATTSVPVPAHPEYELVFSQQSTSSQNRHATMLWPAGVRGEAFIYRRDGTAIGNHTIHALLRST